MKKVILFVAVVSAFSFASCKKDRTCTCITTSTVPGSTTQTDITTYPKSSKHNASLYCVSKTSTDGGYTRTETCELK